MISLSKVFDSIVDETDILSVLMYPQMSARRKFVHRCWVIAKTTEDDDLKVAVASDPYFQLGRSDLLILLKTKDLKLIQFILEQECKLTVTQDDSFKLISIKKSQMDHNSLTNIRLIDFLSVIIMNKRHVLHDIQSPILFNHSEIL